MEKDLEKTINEIADKQRKAFEQERKVIEGTRQGTIILGKEIFKPLSATIVDSETTYEELDEKFDLKNNHNIAKPKNSKGLFEVRLYKGKMKRKKR